MNGERPRDFERSGAPSEPPIAVDPADANTIVEWVGGVMDKLGFTVAVVTIPYSAKAMNALHDRYEEGIGIILGVAGLGHFDSSRIRVGEPIRLFFNLVTRSLPSGLLCLQEYLDMRGLLPLCRIGTADPDARVWRVFYPALPEPQP